MAAFATVEDVESRWRPLTAAEGELAGVLLDDASDMIRSRWSDIDSRVIAGAISSETLVRITAGMVKRAMLNAGVEGVTQGTETVGPFSHSASYANPNGNLYLSADDVRFLDGVGFGKRVRMGWLA